MTAGKADIVGRHADSVVDAFPSHDLKTLEAELENDVDPYEVGWERTIAIAAELRLRAATGVRKWRAD